jgi:outer membrane murein-binding lipoprotein Lpp
LGESLGAATKLFMEAKDATQSMRVTTLEAQIDQLKMENDILRRTVGFLLAQNKVQSKRLRRGESK